MGLGKTLEAVWLHSSALIIPNVTDAGAGAGRSPANQRTSILIDANRRASLCASPGAPLTSKNLRRANHRQILAHRSSVMYPNHIREKPM